MRLLVSLAVALTFSLGCGSSEEPDPDPGPDIGSIEVTPNPIGLLQQQTAQLQVAVLNPEGQLLTGVAVTFATSDSAVATVTNTGTVTGRTAGTATITVTAGSVDTDVPVTVQAVSSAIVISPSPAAVPQTGTIQLTAVVTDINGDPIPGAPVFWSSQATFLATVTAAGLVDPVGPAGEVTILATSGVLSASTQVRILPVPTTLEVTPTSVAIGKAGSRQLTVRVLDANQQEMYGLGVSYTASNGLISISPDGRITGNGAAGASSVTVSVGSLSRQVPVTLVDYTGLTGLPDGSVQMPPDMLPYSADIRSDGRIVIVGSNSSLNSARMVQGTLAGRSFSPVPVSGMWATDVAFSVSGATAWLANIPNAQASEVDPLTGSVLGNVTGTSGVGMQFSILPSSDGSRVYLAGDRQFYEIDAATRTVTRSLTIGSVAFSLVKHPTADLFFTTGDGPVQVIDPAAGTVRELALYAKNLAIHPDGTRLFIVDESPNLRVTDPGTGVIMATWQLPCGPWGIAYVESGNTLLVTCSNANRVVLLDAATGAILSDFEALGFPRRITVAPGGLQAVIVADYGGVHFVR